MRSITTAVKKNPGLGHGQVPSIFTHPVRGRDTYEVLDSRSAMSLYIRLARRKSEESATKSPIQAENAEEELGRRRRKNVVMRRVRGPCSSPVHCSLVAEL